MVWQNVLSFLLVVALSLSLYGVADTGPTMCPERYQRKGCYKDSFSARTLPELLIFARDELKGSWENWDTFIQSFVCRCSIEARKKGFKYFGIQFYAECWSGNVTAAVEYATFGTSMACTSRESGPCKQNSSICAGNALTNFVYELLEAPTTKPPASVSDCKDLDKKCPKYAADNFCHRYPDVLKYCPLSCGQC